MAGDGVRGDRTDEWRRSYLRVRKELVGTQSGTNRNRLLSIGAQHAVGGRWLDLGAGNGNLVPSILELGASQVVAIDYQPELLGACPPSADRVVASAVGVPLRSSSIDVVVVMDVLHHLEPAQLVPTLAESHRVLRPGGHLLISEPASTLARRALQVALDSPLSECTQFSRDKRRMVEQEAATLFPWLRRERDLPDVLGREGFAMVQRHQGLIRRSYRCVRN